MGGIEIKAVSRHAGTFRIGGFKNGRAVREQNPMSFPEEIEEFAEGQMLDNMEAGDERERTGRKLAEARDRIRALDLKSAGPAFFHHANVHIYPLTVVTLFPKQLQPLAPPTA